VTRAGTGLLLIFLGLTSCGPHPSHRVPHPDTARVEAQDPATDNAIVMSNVDLYMHEINQTLGQPRKPTFWVHADEVSLTQEESGAETAGEWAFVRARAVIYASHPDDEDMTFEAARGRFRDEDRALLEGDVRARLGTMEISLDDVEWVNADQEAHTDKPVQIVDRDTKLDAASLHLYPEKREFVLTGVDGVIRLERNES